MQLCLRVMNEMSLSTVGKMISFVASVASVASVAIFLVAIGVWSKLTCGSVEAKWMLINFTRIWIKEKCALVLQYRLYKD